MRSSGPADSVMAIAVLGPLTVETSARLLGPRDFGGHKPREIFQLLVAARGAVVHKGDLSVALWPGARPRNVEATIETYLSVLRRSLTDDRVQGRELIANVANGYRLHVERCDIDIDRFDRLIQQATVEPTDRAEVRTRRQAANLPRGALMPEVRATWVDETRDTYHLRVVHNLVQLAEAELRIRSFVSSAQHAEAALHLEPFLEESLRVLMLAHYASGHQGLARAQYDKFRHQLETELGQAPTAGTVTLIEAIDAGQPIEELIGAWVPTPRRVHAALSDDRPGSDRRRANNQMPFVGRASELAQVDAVLEQGRNGHPSSILLVGGRGSGKTELLDRVDDANVDLIGRARYPQDRYDNLPCALPLLDALERRGSVGLGQRYVDGRFLCADELAIDTLAEIILESGPMVFMLDDLDQAPRPVVSALGRLVAAHPYLPLGVVATSSKQPENFIPPAVNFRFDTVLELKPLTADECATLGPEGPELWALSGGQPGTLADLWRWRAAGGEAISPSLRASVLHDLRFREPAEVAILQAVATSDVPLDVDELAALVASDASEPGDEIDQLVAAGVLMIERGRLHFVEPIIGLVILEHFRSLQHGAGRRGTADH
ncbi:MAG: BTAD domain-containing putative transcriptional regulator [Acidimicrobiales bacterium]